MPSTWSTRYGAGTGDLLELGVQGDGPGQVLAERLLDRHPAARLQAGGAERPQRRGEHPRRQGQVGDRRPPSRRRRAAPRRRPPGRRGRAAGTAAAPAARPARPPARSPASSASRRAVRARKVPSSPSCGAAPTTRRSGGSRPAASRRASAAAGSDRPGRRWHQDERGRRRRRRGRPGVAPARWRRAGGRAAGSASIAAASPALIRGPGSVDRRQGGGPQGVDRAGRVLRAVHGAAGHEHVAPASAQRSIVSAPTPPSTCSHTSRPVPRIASPAAPQLGQHHVEEALAAEAGLHRHDQQHVELGEQVDVRLDRGGRAQRHPGAGPGRPQRRGRA